MTMQAKTNWQHTKIGHLGRVVTGKTPPTKNQEYYGDKYPFITPTDISGNSIFVEKPDRYLSEDGAQKVASSKLPRNSVCYTCIASVGKIAITKEDSFTNQQINSVIADPDKADYRYIFYLLRKITPQIKGMVGGAASPIINKSAFENIDIEIPETKIQKRIADVLSTYDDLIENNTCRIKILEQIAQATYTEWFVNFRFSGHEKVKMTDSGTDFGKIPEGWKIGKLSDLANITMGQSPSSDFYNESGEGLPFHQGVTNFGFRFPTTATFSTGGTRRANTGDILFSVRAPVGRINVADKDMIIGRGLSAMRSTSESQSYLLYALKNLFAIEDLIGGGAIFASVTRADLNNFPVVIPDAKVIGLFEKLVNPLDGLIFNLSHNLSILRHSRDLLLPKLVTGEIQV